MSYRLTRDCFRPKEFTAHREDAATHTEAYFTEYVRAGKTVYVLMAFGGKRAKPDLHHSYPTELARETRWQQYLKDEADYHRRKAEARADRNGFKHSLSLGSILAASWGYDQTNAEFFEVVEVVGDHFVRLRQIESKVVECSHPSSERVVPVPGAFRAWSVLLDKNGRKGNLPTLKRVGHGNCVRLASFTSASPWDGTPRHNTGFGWGH